MERELCNRYASMTYVIADLDRVAHGQEPLGPHGQAPGPGPHWRRRLASVLGLGLAAVLILLGAVLVFPDPFYRRLPPGSLDPAFGTGGKVYTDVGTQSEDRCSAILVQPDGKILAAGSTEQPGTGLDFAVLRYLPDGHLDSRFRTAGKAITNLGGAYEQITAAALQSDGKIVAVGMIGERDPKNDPPLACDWAVVHFNREGSLDNGFGQDGKVITHFGGRDQLTGVAVQPDDDKIVAVGMIKPPGRPRNFAVVRYRPDGQLDRGFGRGGMVVRNLGGAFESDDHAHGLALQPDGKMVVGGYSNLKVDGSTPDDYDFTLVRSTPTAASTTGR